MVTTTTRVEVERFDGTGDFSLWTIRMMAHFGVAGLREVVLDDNFETTVTRTVVREQTGDEAAAEASESQTVLDPVKLDKDERAKGMIILNVGDHVLRKIKHCTTAAAMWKLLERLYMSKSLPNRIFVQSQFYTFRCDSSKTIDENVDTFLKIVAEMGSLDVSVTDEIQAIVFLCSLPVSYDQLKHTLKYGKETLTLEEVISAARSEQRDRVGSGKTDSVPATVLYTQDRGRPLKKKDSYESRGRNRSKSKTKKVTCWYCKKEGHTKKDCYSRRRKMESDGEYEAAVAIGQLEFSGALNVSNDSSFDNWVIDSGCTHHMTSRRDWFVDFQDNHNTKIFLGDSHTVETSGIGSVRLNVPGGTVKVLNNVRYVPNLRRNLISTGTLDKLGFTHSGGNGKILFHKNNKLALQGSLKNGLYILDGETVPVEACLTESGTTESGGELSVWHSRLGHMSHKNMQVLVKEGVLKKKDVGKKEFCEHCIMGKSKRVSFETGKHDTKHVLDYVHSDLWGSQNVQPTLSGNKYFLSITDDYSRKVWVMFLKTKDETFARFCEWKILVENKIDRKVKCLRTDNGLEFCNKVFDEFCRKQGIERHMTCAYTPQQNGVAERMNRTIMEKVRCLLSESGLEEIFWAEAVSASVYIINRSPCSAVNFRCPEELWLGKKPGYKHMRKFGSLAYVYVDQGKLKPRAIRGVFIGYPMGTKGYKVWLPEENRCVISRNVKFDETQVYGDLCKQKGLCEQTQEQRSSGQGGVTQDIEHTLEQDSSGQGGVTQDIEQTLEQDSSGQGGAAQDIHIGEDVLSQPAISEEAERQSLTNYQVARDRTRRNIVPPVRFSDYECAEEEAAFALSMCELMNAAEEPRDYLEAKESKEWPRWREAINEEMESLLKNKTWVLVNRPVDRKVISCKWLFKIKPGAVDTESVRYKARLVARGFSQTEGVDYQEVFAPVVKHVSIRVLLSLVVNLNLELEQMDVKTAFLHGNLDEELYMQQPEGFEVQTKKDQVCLLKKSLYGLKQSPRQWNKRFDQFMISEGFIRSEHDACVYTKRITENEFVYLLLYVDDMLIAAKSMSEIQKIKEQLNANFEMKDLGAAKRILGMEIIRDRVRGTLRLSQTEYLQKVLTNFRMEQAKVSQTPIGAHFKLSSVKGDEECIDSELVPYCSAVGSIMYAMVGSRPDLAYGIGLVSRFMSRPGKMHWEAVKWLLRYIKSSVQHQLLYKSCKELQVQGYCDSDFAADLDKRRSISGYVFTVGENTVSWKSSLQKVVALSTTEAEYIALTEAVKEAVWLRGLLEDFGVKQKSVKLWCDSQSAICLSKNSVFHERTKHIAVKYNFIREVIDSGDVEVLKIHTSRNPADVLTKVVPVSKFNAALNLLNLTQA